MELFNAENAIENPGEPLEDLEPTRQDAPAPSPHDRMVLERPPRRPLRTPRSRVSFRVRAMKSPDEIAKAGRPVMTRTAAGCSPLHLEASWPQACVLRPVATASPPVASPAPGAPGAMSHFGLARKDCVGTARNTSRRCGSPSPVACCPTCTTRRSTTRTSRPCSTSSPTARRSPTCRPATPPTPSKSLDDSGMSCRVTSTAKNGKYTLVTDYVTDPARNSVAMETRSSRRVVSRTSRSTSGWTRRSTATAAAVEPGRARTPAPTTRSSTPRPAAGPRVDRYRDVDHRRQPRHATPVSRAASRPSVPGRVERIRRNGERRLATRHRRRLSTSYANANRRQRGPDAGRRPANVPSPSPSDSARTSAKPPATPADCLDQVQGVAQALHQWLGGLHRQPRRARRPAGLDRHERAEIERTY